MRYRVLGALQIVGGEGPWQDAARNLPKKVRILLVTLLIQANQVVSINQLIGGLWGEHPPRRATAALHVYVSQLRKFLAPDGQWQNSIITKSPGYLIQVQSDELDLHVFRRLVSQGRSHMRAGRYDQASDVFGSALDLWSGPALGDLRDGAAVNGFAAWLEELRIECIGMLVESNLMLGRHRELVSFLYALVSEHPLHETHYLQLMTALHRCDRRAEALRVYQRARETITAELGLEPNAELQDLYHTIQLGEEAEYHSAV